MHPALEKEFKRFQTVKKEFIDRIEQCSETQRTFKPSAGEWSLLEVFEHIQISEKGILAFFKKYPPHESKFKIKTKNKFYFFLLTLFFKSGKKVKMPAAGLAPTGQKNWEELKISSSKTQEELLEFLKGFPQEKLSYSVFKHPVSGGMNMESAVAFFANHVIHHTHQLKRIQKSTSFPKE